MLLKCIKHLHIWQQWLFGLHKLKTIHIKNVITFYAIYNQIHIWRNLLYHKKAEKYCPALKKALDLDIQVNICMLFSSILNHFKLKVCTVDWQWATAQISHFTQAMQVTHAPITL